ncbi:hypothetical protein BGZ94_006196 [Podila epigama]|nr:hypothetical protein BGZ94_006196 [Podila epigama]
MNHIKKLLAPCSRFLADEPTSAWDGPSFYQWLQRNQSTILETHKFKSTDFVDGWIGALAMIQEFPPTGINPSNVQNARMQEMKVRELRIGQVKELHIGFKASLARKTPSKTTLPARTVASIQSSAESPILISDSDDDMDIDEEDKPMDVDNDAVVAPITDDDDENYVTVSDDAGESDKQAHLDLNLAFEPMAEINKPCNSYLRPLVTDIIKHNAHTIVFIDGDNQCADAVLSVDPRLTRVLFVVVAGPMLRFYKRRHVHVFITPRPFKEAADHEMFMLLCSLVYVGILADKSVYICTADRGLYTNTVEWLKERGIDATSGSRGNLFDYLCRINARFYEPFAMNRGVLKAQKKAEHKLQGEKDNNAHLTFSQKALQKMKEREKEREKREAKEAKATALAFKMREQLELMQSMKA